MRKLLYPAGLVRREGILEVLEEKLIGEVGEGSNQGTCIKDPWTKTMGGLNVRGRGG